MRRSEIEFATDTLKKSWHYFRDGAAELTHNSRVKLYSPGQLATFFKLEGFADVRIYGGLDAQALDLNSPRCIVVGSKP